MVSVRKIRAVYFVLLVATLTTLVSANFITDALGTVYGGLSNLSAAIKEKADSAYHEAAKAKKGNATGETKVIVEACDEIKKEVETVKKNPNAIASAISTVTALLGKLGDSELTDSVKKNLEYAQDLIKLGDTADTAFAMDSLQGIVQLLNGKEEQELDAASEVGFTGKV